MNTGKPIALLLSLFISLTLVCPLGAFASGKRRIAVLPFDYGAINTAMVGGYDVGKGVSSILITKLVDDGTYSVVERQMLDNIMKEQNLSVSDRADPATACKIGKLLSVDAIIVGTVTQFGLENHSTGVSGGSIPVAAGYIPYVGGIGIPSFGSHKSKAKVTIDARIVDINTSEILGVVRGTGESKRSSVSLAGINMDSTDFSTTIAGEATSQAVDELGNQLIASAAKIPDNQAIAALNVEGKIADVSSSQIMVNVGKQKGIATGDHLQVERSYKTVRDPETGKVLKELSNIIAVLQINQVDPNSATGVVVKGGDVKVGDTVRKVTTEVASIVVQPVTASTVGSASTATTTRVSGSLVKRKTPQAH